MVMVMEGPVSGSPFWRNKGPWVTGLCADPWSLVRGAWFLGDGEFLEHASYSKRVVELYERHSLGKDPRSEEFVHWRKMEKVWLRFKVITSLMPGWERSSILDYGCGNGLFYRFLASEGFKGYYEGWDASRRMIDTASILYPHARFKVVDIIELNDDMLEGSERFDYVVVSGVFYIKARDKNDKLHGEWVRRILVRLWKLVEKGLVFNCMSEYVDFRNPELYYCSIAEITNFVVNNLSRYFVLRHDYGLYEYTVAVYKRASLVPDDFKGMRNNIKTGKEESGT